MQLWQALDTVINDVGRLRDPRTGTLSPVSALGPNLGLPKRRPSDVTARLLVTSLHPTSFILERLLITTNCVARRCTGAAHVYAAA